MSCAAITKAGRPCNGWGRFEGACHVHSTPEQRAAYYQRQEDARRVEQQSWWGRVPAYWTWSVASLTAIQRRLAATPADGHGQREFDALSDWQAGRCAVCGGTYAEQVIDHDHRTWMVRGLLCRSCNTREGLSSADDGRFYKYRRRPPADLLGVEIEYTGWGEPPSTSSPANAAAKDAALAATLASRLPSLTNDQEDA